MRVSKALSLLLVGGFLCAAGAHDFWVDGANKDAKFKAFIGYGHDFPAPEKIADKRVKLFEPLAVLGKDGKKAVLAQKGENYEFEGKELARGTYALLGEYKSTFWSRDTDNKWHMETTRENGKNIEFCELATMQAKAIVNVGGAQDDFITKPLGQKIEIVPLENPANFKANKPFKVQIFLDGKPLKRAKLTGTFDEFLKDKHAFSGTADLEGKIDVLALKGGKWMLEVTHEQPFSDTKKCDEEIIIATLTFNVKE